MNAKLAERLHDASARVGRIIHIPSMIAADIESQESDVEDFLFDDLDDATLARLDTAIPGLKDVVDREFADYETEGGGKRARGLYLESVAEFLARRSPVDFIVQMQWQIKDYHYRGKRYPLGSYASGWGYYATRWYAGKSIAACVQQGIRDAHAEGRAAWEKAPVYPPLSTGEV